MKLLHAIGIMAQKKTFAQKGVPISTVEAYSIQNTAITL